MGSMVKECRDCPGYIDAYIGAKNRAKTNQNNGREPVGNARCSEPGCKLLVSVKLKEDIGPCTVAHTIVIGNCEPEGV